jgi:hypothetical protein
MTASADECDAGPEPGAAARVLDLGSLKPPGKGGTPSSWCLRSGRRPFKPEIAGSNPAEDALEQLATCRRLFSVCYLQISTHLFHCQVDLDAAVDVAMLTCPSQLRITFSSTPD